MPAEIEEYQGKNIRPQAAEIDIFQLSERNSRTESPFSGKRPAQISSIEFKDPYRQETASPGQKPYGVDCVDGICKIPDASKQADPAKAESRFHIYPSPFAPRVSDTKSAAEQIVPGTPRMPDSNTETYKSGRQEQPIRQRTDSGSERENKSVYEPRNPESEEFRISELKPRYETNEIGDAIKAAKEAGLPLAVHIGASWCGPCQTMERNVWPQIEGTKNKQGSLQGKAVVLHIDIDEVRRLGGEDARLSREILKDRPNSVPLLRVFQIDQSGAIRKTAENSGALFSSAALEKFLIKGGVKR